MTEWTWRDKCRPIIAQVLRDTAGMSENEIKKALYYAYPFGLRERYPYKIWLDEIKVQRKTKKHTPKTHDGRILVIDPAQERMF